MIPGNCKSYLYYILVDLVASEYFIDERFILILRLVPRVSRLIIITVVNNCLTKIVYMQICLTILINSEL
jgi:hypothetical protein